MRWGSALRRPRRRSKPPNMRRRKEKKNVAERRRRVVVSENAPSVARRVRVRNARVARRGEAVSLSDVGRADRPGGRRFRRASLASESDARRKRSYVVAPSHTTWRVRPRRARYHHTRSMRHRITDYVDRCSKRTHLIAVSDPIVASPSGPRRRERRPNSRNCSAPRLHPAPGRSRAAPWASARGSSPVCLSRTRPPRRRPARR